MKVEKQRKTIFRHFFDGVYTKEEALRAFQYISDPESKDEFDDLAAELWEESAVEEYTITDSQREQYKREARHLLDSMKFHKKRFWYRSGAIAASIAVLVAIAWGGFYFVNNAFTRELVYVEVCTSYGEKKQLLLPDGTQLILNSCSYVRYLKQFADNERRIELEGEGYFKVAHNEAKPFIINTNRFDVRALGTSFNIKSYITDEIVAVSVESGKVQVDVPEAVMRLVANEQVYINTISEEYRKRRESEQVAAWIRGSLHFNSTPIRDVAKVLERAYDCRITFDPNQNFDNLICGEHDNKDLESVLKAIEYTSHIKYKKEGRNILLYK
jgi:ferric-dicitrate binding protein FerR (iron transport regulator)